MVEECPKVLWSSAASTMGKLKLQIYVCLYYLSLVDICKYFAWIGVNKKVKIKLFLVQIYPANSCVASTIDVVVDNK